MSEELHGLEQFKWISDTRSITRDEVKLKNQDQEENVDKKGENIRLVQKKAWFVGWKSRR